MKKIIGIIFIFAMCIVICACNSGTNNDMKELENIDNSNAVGDMFNVADDMFEIAGNMFEDAGDLVTQPITTESNTKTTQNNTDVTNNTNTDVNNDVQSILRSCIGKPLVIFMEKVNQIGYEATYLADGVDFTSFIDSMKEDYVTGELKIDATKKTVVVDLVLASSIEIDKQEEALKGKLELGSSWISVEKYGQNIYGSSFELNYLTGKITQVIEDENTWFLKASCEVNGQKKVCEAKVTGTTDSPKVVFFDVY